MVTIYLQNEAPWKLHNFELFNSKYVIMASQEIKKRQDWATQNVQYEEVRFQKTICIY